MLVLQEEPCDPASPEGKASTSSTGCTVPAAPRTLFFISLLCHLVMRTLTQANTVMHARLRACSHSRTYYPTSTREKPRLNIITRHTPFFFDDFQHMSKRLVGSDFKPYLLHPESRFECIKLDSTFQDTVVENCGVPAGWAASKGTAKTACRVAASRQLPSPCGKVGAHAPLA